MVNPEELLQCLDEFSKLKPKDIPRELEEYLLYVAKTGDPVYQWPLVKYLFREKMLSVITDFYESCPSIDLPPCPNVDPFNYETMKANLLEHLDSFSNAPFTVQRLCELLTTPRKEYTRVDKFMRAIEKNILVVSTKEPGCSRARGEAASQLTPPQDALMNGVAEGRDVGEGEGEGEGVPSAGESAGVAHAVDPAGDGPTVWPAKPKGEGEGEVEGDVEGEVETEVDVEPAEAKPSEVLDAPAEPLEDPAPSDDASPADVESGISCSSDSSDCATAEMNQTLETNGSLEIASVESEVMSPLDALEDVTANISPPSPDDGARLGECTPPPTFAEMTADEDTQDAVRCGEAEDEGDGDSKGEEDEGRVVEGEDAEDAPMEVDGGEETVQDAPMAEAQAQETETEAEVEAEAETEAENEAETEAEVEPMPQVEDQTQDQPHAQTEDAEQMPFSVV